MLPSRLPLSREALLGLGLRGLHCGSGITLHPGFLNIDVQPLRADGQSSAPGRVVCFQSRYFYLQHDQTRPLPIADGAVEWVFSEHFIEHIEPQQAIAWLTEVRRVLQPGGLARISTPDLALYADGYRDPAQRFYQLHRQRLADMGIRNTPPGRAWMLNQIFRHYGHQWLYDFEEIVAAATQAGFAPAAIRRVAFATGSVPALAALDQPIRSDESLYVELRRD